MCQTEWNQYESPESVTTYKNTDGKNERRENKESSAWMGRRNINKISRKSKRMLQHYKRKS